MTIPARFSGVCPECGERWQPGDLIRAEADGRWKHATCPLAVDDLTPMHTICTTCWLDHPEGACDR